MVLALDGLVALVLKSISLVLPHQLYQTEVGVFEQFNLIPLLTDLLNSLACHLLQIKLDWDFKWSIILLVFLVISMSRSAK
jgi:hypothetical protein